MNRQDASGWQADVGLALVQRDWLSANSVAFAAQGGTPATVVDTGYARHAELTAELIGATLPPGQALGRILNTHLHSDHCGGNRLLQQRQPELQTWVPAPSLRWVQGWNEDRLSYRATGQWCERFRADGALHPGQTVALGPAYWQVWAAPGHDADAVLLFEPQTRTLIAGDALWEDRLAIIFPEIDGEPGFAATRATLDLIERLAPAQVIPGHGAAFADVAAALAASRQRLAGFERAPVRHLRHAARALLMFHMLDVRSQDHAELLAWLLGTPIFIRMWQQLARLEGRAPGLQDWAAALLSGALDDGLLAASAGGDMIGLPDSPGS